MAPAILFDHVWKKFRTGERHDSLRDLIPGITRRLFAKPPQNDLKTEEFWALQDVSFAVEPGKALGIIGSNGAGKSTTLKLLTRILKPTHGRYETRGRVGALIEVAAGFHPDLTGRENVYLQGAIMGMPRTEIDRQFDAIVDFAGIGPFIDTPVKRYSSGMNARLGFSIAAHLQPDVLLIDEVLAVGDMEFQHRCFDRMQSFAAQGTAIAFVSHNLKAVMDLCDQTMLLEKGRVKAIGKTSEVVAAYMEKASASASTEAELEVEVVAYREGMPLPNLHELRPGDRLRVTGDLRLLAAAKQGALGVGIWDTSRSNYAFEGSLDMAGIAPINGGPGTIVPVDFSLTLHLNRGLYQLRLNLHDFATQHFLLPFVSVAAFNIEERTSQNGVANLYLTPAPDFAGAATVAPGHQPSSSSRSTSR